LGRTKPTTQPPPNQKVGFTHPTAFESNPLPSHLLWWLDHPLRPQPPHLLPRQPQQPAVDLFIVLPRLGGAPVYAAGRLRQLDGYPRYAVGMLVQQLGLLRRRGIGKTLNTHELWADEYGKGIAGYSYRELEQTNDSPLFTRTKR